MNRCRHNLLFRVVHNGFLLAGMCVRSRALMYLYNVFPMNHRDLFSTWWFIFWIESTDTKEGDSPPLFPSYLQIFLGICCFEWNAKYIFPERTTEESSTIGINMIVAGNRYPEDANLNNISKFVTISTIFSICHGKQCS